MTELFEVKPQRTAGLIMAGISFCLGLWMGRLSFALTAIFCLLGLFIVLLAYKTPSAVVNGDTVAIKRPGKAGRQFQSGDLDSVRKHYNHHGVPYYVLRLDGKNAFTFNFSYTNSEELLNWLRQHGVPMED